MLSLLSRMAFNAALISLHDIIYIIFFLFEIYTPNLYAVFMISYFAAADWDQKDLWRRGKEINSLLNRPTSRTKQNLHLYFKDLLYV